MRKLLTAVSLCAALLPTAAIANHEVPDPQPLLQFALERAHNNAPVPVFAFLHLDRDAQTWRIDCDSPAPDPGPDWCPLVLDGTLDLDPHYGPVTDPGCSLPKGTDGAGRAQLSGMNLSGLQAGHMPADLRGVGFARTPVAASALPVRTTVLHLQGEWFDEHGRADRMEAVFRTSSTGPAADLCGSSGVAHMFMDGYVWLVGAVR